LNPALRTQGLSVREERSVINVVFYSIRDALVRHERVELPIGTFTVLPNPGGRGWRFGKVVTFDKYRIKFQPSEEMKLAAVAAPPSQHYPKRKKREKKPVKSEPAISTEFIVDFIRKNVLQVRWRWFFNELRAGSSTQAVFTFAKPKPGESRLLDESVIEECAPAQMPEDQIRLLTYFSCQRSDSY
jgi:nucleoid DNA-binding protein